MGVEDCDEKRGAKGLRERENAKGGVQLSVERKDGEGR